MDLFAAAPVTPKQKEIGVLVRFSYTIVDSGVSRVDQLSACRLD